MLYSILQRLMFRNRFWNLFIARKYVYNRVMLCGDAAHSWAPFGGLGGNCGYGDANNLAWKLVSVIKGWARESILQTYDEERREAGLRYIMTVLNFAPDRSQLMRMATIVKYRWLWWTVRYRWQFASTGAHSGNHMMSEGLSYGIRYNSQIIYRNVDHQGIDSVESPPNMLIPSITAGGRLLHLRMEDRSTLFQKISTHGYTLLVIEPEVVVTDRLNLLDIDSEAPLSSALIAETEPFIGEISAAFHARHIPLSIVDIRSSLQDIFASDASQLEICKLYDQYSVILVRPDLHIAWTFRKDLARKTGISVREIQHIAQVSCMEILDSDVAKTVKTTADWLTRRFITNIQGYRTLHDHAIYVENEDKGEVLKILSKNKDPQGKDKETVNYDNYLTKASESSTASTVEKNKTADEAGSRGSMELSKIYSSNGNDAPSSHVMNEETSKSRANNTSHESKV